ncbi:hypothetical protein H4R34_000281 [Dimargaris verticillata]|uniref:Nucleolar complex-associated protein 3 n=1 Tax=Dimargaris verticillata TaxID=2761393 RepID=A0A9W8B7D6_9FUNG|nr:hypothetical protein H4R34_000281 [Dimargaris verticillata]
MPRRDRTRMPRTVDYEQLFERPDESSSSEDEIVDYNHVESESGDDALPAIDLDDSDDSDGHEEPALTVGTVNPFSLVDAGADSEAPEALNALYDELLDQDVDSARPTVLKQPRASRKQHVKQDEDAALEERYERNLSLHNDAASGPKALPIKLSTGKLIHRRQVVEAPVAPEQPESLTEAPPTERPAKQKPVALPYGGLGRKEYIVKTKIRLAERAQKLIENPEANIALLKKIHQTAVEDEAIPSLCKLALLTELAIFQDVIPGYPIRALTEQEKTARVSKEVRQLRQYEESLVTGYQKYLQFLDRVIKQGPRKQSTTSTDQSGSHASLAQVALQCMCQLLKAAPHFNFRVNLLAAVIGQMCSKKSPAMAKMCCQAIVELFQNDVSGRYSLDAMTIMSKAIKARKYQVAPEVIQSFLYLRLRDELNPQVIHGSDATAKAGGKKRRHPVNDAGQKVHLSKKMRKHRKESRVVEQELKEAEAEYSQEEKEKWHSETLKAMFIIYFRILKTPESHNLLPVVLEGLAKFAHLISVDYFDDLLKYLKRIMDGSLQVPGGAQATETDCNTVSSRTALLCIVTAFQLLSGQGEALNIDLTEFYTQLYRLLPDLASNPHLEKRAIDPHGLGIIDDDAVASQADMLLKTLEIMFFKRGKVPVNRVAAFAKRLCTVGLHLPPNVLIKCVALLRMLLSKYPRLDQLMSSEESLANGVYLGELDDPELCNPFATSLWEIQALRKHYHPRVREAVKGLLVQCKNSAR